MADRLKPAVELEAEARAINATDWQPLSGMVKKRCGQCRYWFAVPAQALFAPPVNACPRPDRGGGLGMTERVGQRSGAALLSSVRPRIQCATILLIHSLKAF
jgi:hypothetical protein